MLVLYEAIIMKRILTKLPEKLHKNQSLHFKEHFTDIKHDISHIFMHFFFCPTNLSFTFNWVLIQYSSPEFIYICTVWLSFTALGILEFIQYLYAFFERKIKILMRLNAFFLWFKVAKCFLTLLFSMRNSLLVTSELLLTLISYYYMSSKILVILCMLCGTFCVWLWPQLNWCSSL